MNESRKEGLLKNVIVKQKCCKHCKKILKLGQRITIMNDNDGSQKNNTDKLE